MSNQAPVYTGNNVVAAINGAVLGLVETLSITRNVNRRPVYAVGSPLFQDAPVTQASVTVTATNMVPLTPSNTLNGNNVPTGSLLAALTAKAYTIDIYAISSLVGGTVSGSPLYSVSNAFYNQDAVSVPNTDVLTYNLSWIAQDTQAWQS